MTGQTGDDLSSSEMQRVAIFARFVDQQPNLRQRLQAAESLEQVVQIAHAFGFTEISDGLLIRASKRVLSCDWIWQEFGSRWSDHVFTLSLASLTQAHLPPHLSDAPMDDDLLHDGSEELVDRALELRTFYEYASITAEIQEEFRQARTADEAVAIARSHGFLIRKSDFLLNMRTHGSYLRPWMCGDQSQRLRTSSG